MREVTGSIVTMHREGSWVVVPTNIGWKKDLTNVMGAGLARYFADTYRDLPAIYGKFCCNTYLKERGASSRRSGRPSAKDRLSYVLQVPQYKLFLAPSKPLDVDCPWLSWKQSATMRQVTESLEGLQRLVDERIAAGDFIPKVYVPLLGCGNGGLSHRLVRPLMASRLSDRFILVNMNET